MQKLFFTFLTSTALAALLSVSSASLLAEETMNGGMRDNRQSTTTTDNQRSEMENQRSEMAEEQRNANQIVTDAVKVVEKMKRDEELEQALSQAKGVFIVPDYGRGAAVIGAQAGQGVMLTQEKGEWSNPVFYNLGAINVGAQIGGEAGEIALLLMNDKATENFKQNNNFSLNADADLTIINWSAQAQASYGQGDVILWSDTEGAFAGGAIGISNIMVDEEANQAYYAEGATPSTILSGTAKTSDNVPRANPIAKVLP